ncbi:HAD superfamily hydrolase (TIGR01490 family) [Acetoanaerobium pronyense]|uniref:phosphoserine phosphatase n=1 Tax=Acetoanaerobium pronyense TaxID=1482736 RepID=A0ABS4KIR2_9FIRM|nr:HAD family hydrolase [Acetoanaerobium pronyense]MBP2027678.1 HAD superfamily hydrolase (TIGR01490 family) [Acetoanaerobium pronyense]
MKKIAAFFDIDGTFYRDSLMTEHFKKLIKFDIIDPLMWHGHAKTAFNDWDKRQGNYDDYLLELASIYIDALTGVPRESIEFTSQNVIDQKSERVYRYTRSRIKWHKDSGHTVIFISGSPDYLVKRMAKKYNVTEFKGTEYIFRDDIFTGRIVPMWDSESKDKAINYFVEKHNIDLGSSFAYGDTHGDFSMLKRVGKPIAINPAKELLMDIKNDTELRDKAEIIIERKDVIYSFHPDQIQTLY